MATQDMHEFQEDEQGEYELPPVSLFERAKYFAGSALLLGGGLELMGAGATGLILAAVGASAVTYFSPELKEALGKRLAPTVESANRRIDWKRLGAKDYQPSVKEAERALLSTGEASMQFPTLAPVSSQAVLSDLFPLFPENETLRLGRAERSGQAFHPHVNGLIGQGLIVAAMQGYGKSQLVGRMIEQCGKCGLIVVVLDHKGEHETITEMPSINGLRAGGDASFDFHLTAQNAGEFVSRVMQNRQQAIVNLPSYGIGWLGKATIVASVGRALMDCAEEKRRKKQRVLPCLVLLDEAQLYIPQDQTLLPPEAQVNKDILGELKNSYFALATNGRSAGYTMGFATQSLTFIAKWAIKSCAIQMFGRHVEKNALDMCEDIIDRTIATREQIKAFGKGVFVTFGFTEDPLVVQFDKKESRDLSETPTIEWLREPSHPGQPFPAPSMSDRALGLDRILALYNAGRITDQQMFALMNQLPDLDPEDTRYGEDGEGTMHVLEEEEDAQSGMVVLGKGRSITCEEFEIALRLRKSGMSTGYRDLMEPFDISEHHAKALNKLILDALEGQARD